MKASIYTFFGVLIGGSAIALLLIGLHKKKEDGAEGLEGPATPAGQQTTRANSAAHRDAKARPREPQFQSVEEAEQALLDFDMNFMRARDPAENRRGLYRLRGLAARIPEAYYSELTARFGKGADNDLDRYVRQMAIYQEWGRVDLEAALADLAGIENARRHSKALHSVFFGATDSDAPAAMKMAETLDIETPGEFGDFERTDLMDTIFDTWIESDPYSAVQWARQAPVPDKRRDQWIADGLRAWSEKDPDAAERWRGQQN